MPASMAASGFDEQARMAMPVSVYLRKACSERTVTATAPSTQKTCGEMAAPRILTEEHSLPVK